MRRTTFAFALLLTALLSGGAGFAAPPEAASAPDALSPAPAAETGEDLGAGACATENALAADLGGDGVAPALGGQDPVGQACYFVRYECRSCAQGVKGCNVYKCWVGPDYYYSYSCGSCGPYC